MSRSGCSTGSSGSNIAAMTAPASAPSTAASSTAAGPRASSTISRASLARDPLGGDGRHRPHALGDARRADGRQRPPAHRRAGGAGPQRHHREFQAAARRADRRRPQIPERDRQRGRRASGRPRGRARRRRREDAVAAVLPRLHGAFAHRLPVPRPSRPAHRRADGRAADRRLWRGRELSRLRRAGAGAADPADRLSRRRRLGGRRAATAVQIFDRDNQPVEREIVALRRLGRARSTRATTPTSCRRRSSSSRSSSRRPCKATSARSRARSRCPMSDFDLAGDRPRHDRRLRHQLLRRHGRQILVRAVRPRAGRHRCRVASSATASRCWSRAGWRCSSASRARPPTRSPRCATRAREGQTHRGRRQRADQLDGARGGPAAADPRRARRSASPRPRRSPASWRCSPRSPRTSRAPRAG